MLLNGDLLNHPDGEVGKKKKTNPQPNRPETTGPAGVVDWKYSFTDKNT